MAAASSTSGSAQSPIWGQTAPDQGKGVKYLVVGPGQTAPVDAKDFIVVQSTTNNVWPGFRALDPSPEKAQAWIDKVRIYPYSRRDSPPKQRFLTPGGKVWLQAQPSGMAYWQMLSEIINQEPVQERDRTMMAMLKPLGIETGRPFKPDPPQTKILEQAALVGEAMAKGNTFDKRFVIGGFRLKEGHPPSIVRSEALRGRKIARQIEAWD